MEYGINISLNPGILTHEIYGYLSLWPGAGRMTLLILFFIIALQSWVRALGSEEFVH